MTLLKMNGIYSRKSFRGGCKYSFRGGNLEYIIYDPLSF
jgi:hypothetical protein